MKFSYLTNIEGIKYMALAFEKGEAMLTAVLEKEGNSS
jgi:hypothetical protein